MHRFMVFPAFFILLCVGGMAQFLRLHRRNMMTSCTPSCKELRTLKSTPDVVCSCSSSCLTYGDCCRNAPFKNNGNQSKNLGCLTLSGLGPVSVVNSCPVSSSSGVLSEACKKGLGVSVPVTSQDTGTSYANYYCAMCNRDSFNVIDWPVEFRCCSQDSTIAEQTVSEHLTYDDERDVMWAVSKLRNGSSVYCECKFYARNNDLQFAKSLELRECKRREISTCSHSWNTESSRKMCNAYLDPIYSGEKVYRNRHCATCNYESGVGLRCSEDWFNPQLMSPPRLYFLCKSLGVDNCEHYVRSKGYALSFSSLLTMKQVQCIPPEDRKCCIGFRYDHFLKKCREIPRRIIT